MGAETSEGRRYTDDGRLSRRQTEIACGVWFTSTGNAMPKMIKYRDEDGIIRQIDHIHEVNLEKKSYGGRPIQEYRCSVVYGNREYLFRLYYYAESCRWKLSWEGWED